VSGPRTTLAAVAVLAFMVGCLGYSLGCDAVRMLQRSTEARATLLGGAPTDRSTRHYLLP
jgi:hypothetical protein